MSDLKDDLPTAMIMAAFTGISWYIAIELNVRLALSIRRRGLYFWSVFLCAWGVLLQPLVIILVNFGIWKPGHASVSLIYLTWWILVVPQSFVLYSRLHLFMEAKPLRWVRFSIVSVSIAFSVPTVVLGVLAQTNMSATLSRPNLAWDKVQLAVFFTQETLLSLLYIRETQKHLKRTAPLHSQDGSSRRVLKHLIYINVLIICLDISLMGMCYSNLFYLQGHYKPCVYGIKLRMEFAILNQLRSTLQSSRPRYSYNRDSRGHRPRSTSDSGLQLTDRSTSLDIMPHKPSGAAAAAAATAVRDMPLRAIPRGQVRQRATEPRKP
ncbi:hypothetical protein BS50DRAFT_630632 [Corynespora cassiicola Philippines]|uniref:DUF7703 domain-containing protein n=1 Tax=Corynespora cassiicola Philippines TaxID=1448308 RepID=A0A2T2P4L9_CORCC|nr:hypothetical protein BS50DRAFT_630632 [Corynespora cassiicola Philippines]